MDKENYERELAERQRRHLANLQPTKTYNWRPCMHDQCTSCHGTGINAFGQTCVHGISCPCPKCTPTY